MLDLSSNQLTSSSLKELSVLKSLKVLDLRMNRVTELVFLKFIPSGIRVLDLTGNTACELPGYREMIITCLPQMLFLDGCSSGVDGQGVSRGTHKQVTNTPDRAEGVRFDYERLKVMRERQEMYYTSRCI